MDTEGRFKIMDEARLSRFFEQFNNLKEKQKAQERIFLVGEEVQVKGSHFRVTRITPKKLILKLLPNKL